MKLPFSKIVNSENETAEIAVAFASILKATDIIALTGDLGTGKTFFVKSALKYFGIDEVTSPTFSIVNTYSGDYTCLCFWHPIHIKYKVT